MSSVFSRFLKQNEDSDQSISEEEILNDDCSGNWTRLGNSVNKKGSMQVLSQLDLLKETMELDSATGASSSSILVRNSFSHEDEIEFPAFDKSDDIDRLQDGSSKCVYDENISFFPKATCYNIADEETISDDDDRVGYRAPLSIKLYEGESTSTGAGLKAAGMIYSSAKPGRSLYSKVDEQNKNSEGSQVKHKNNFMTPSKYTTEDSLLCFKGNNYGTKLDNVRPGNESNSPTHKRTIKSMAELLEGYDVKLKHSQGHELQNVVHQHSVAEFLDGFQEDTVFPLSNLNKQSRTKGRNRPVAHKRSKTSSCRREMNYNNESEASDIGQSSGEEDGPRNLKSTEAGKTMADQFQEIFGVASSSDLPNRTLPRQFGGLHEKLQCMMQNEKEIEMIFLRRLPINASSVGENQYMDVTILSRSLEARLNVCRCDLVGNKEISKTVNFGRTLTIIFSTKICTDVELEVGNLIRIHSPWKEVQLKGNNEVILLSTYFSPI